MLYASNCRCVLVLVHATYEPQHYNDCGVHFCCSLFDAVDAAAVLQQHRHTAVNGVPADMHNFASLVAGMFKRLLEVSRTPLSPSHSSISKS